MGLNVLEWFARESWKFDVFLDTKTLIAQVKLKSESSVLKFYLLLVISFYGRQKVRNNTPHMGFNFLEWFAQESWKFDLFLDTKTLIAPVKLKSTTSVLKFCLLLDIFFFDRAKGTNFKLPTCYSMSCIGFCKNLRNLTFSWTLKPL